MSARVPSGLFGGSSDGHGRSHSSGRDVCRPHPTVPFRQGSAGSSLSTWHTGGTCCHSSDYSPIRMCGRTPCPNGLCRYRKARRNGGRRLLPHSLPHTGCGRIPVRTYCTYTWFPHGGLSPPVPQNVAQRGRWHRHLDSRCPTASVPHRRSQVPDTPAQRR